MSHIPEELQGTLTEDQLKGLTKEQMNSLFFEVRARLVRDAKNKDLDPDEACEVFLSATSDSIGFYHKVVGFGEYGRETDEFGNEFFDLRLPLSHRMLQATRESLRGSEFELEPDLTIPLQCGIDAAADAHAHQSP